ncbi:hypothetical protein BDW72DRAFT_193741 [Aspergillus terricola var. indicus]
MGDPTNVEETRQYIEGAGSMPSLPRDLCLCLFLTNLEIPIVSTALISITSELGGLDKIYWITTAYMLAYVSVLIISGKVSDICARKSTLLALVFISTVFAVMAEQEP